MSILRFDDYQIQAKETAIYPEKGELGGLLYCGLGLGEVGEIQGKIKKILRDDHGIVTQTHIIELRKELGDVLWYCAMLADELGCSLGSIAEDNLFKLKDRQKRNTLKGSGDNR